jgi:O-antigen/teichoic acid export membrane protein
MPRVIPSTIENLKRSPLADRNSFALFLAFSVANGANFGFHLIVARMFEPSSYGALSSLLSITLVLTVPLSAVQAAVTREVVSVRARMGPGFEPDVRRLLSGAAIAAAVGAALIALASSSIQDYLKLSSKPPVYLLGAYLAVVVVGVIPRGVLLGELRYAAVAGGLFLGAGARLAGGAVLTQHGGPAGAMAAVVLSELVSCVFFTVVARSWRRGDQVGLPLRRAGDTLAAFSGIWLLISVDSVLARHYLSARASGYYAAAAVAARAALFLPGAVATIAFPHFAVTGPTARSVLRQALVTVALLSLMVTTVLVVFPTTVMTRLFSVDYRASASTVAILAVSAACLGVTNVLVHFHLAHHSRAAAGPWAGVALILVGMSLFHRSLIQAATVTVVANGAVLALGLVAVALTPVGVQIDATDGPPDLITERAGLPS